MGIGGVFSRFVVLLFILLPGALCAAKPKAVIFDVDDTLVDTNYRSLKIMHDVARSSVSFFNADSPVSPKDQAKLEADARVKLRALHYEQVHYYCSITCRNAGVTVAQIVDKLCGDPKQGTLAASLWGKRFFLDPSYLAYDGEINGANGFVRRLATELSAKVIYLTGRDEAPLRAATEAQLARHGFLGFAAGDDPERALLVMKAKSDPANDVEFKKQWLYRLQQSYLIAAVFDDSADNDNMFADVLDAKVPVIRPQRLSKNYLDRSGLNSGSHVVQITDFLQNDSVEPETHNTVEVDNETLLKDVIRSAKAVRE